MNLRGLQNTLAKIRLYEGGPGLKGYGRIYGGAKGVSLATDVSRMTVDQVLAFQRKMLAGGSASSACGGYQDLRKTLLGLKEAMRLTGSEIWTPDLQDRMALRLMEGRGLSSYMDARLTAEGFCNNLAKEWASLPVVTAIVGSQKTRLKPGQSYYAGDGLNTSHHKPVEILALVKSLRAPGAPQPGPTAVPPPAPPGGPPASPPAATAPRQGWGAWLRSWFQ